MVKRVVIVPTEAVEIMVVGIEMQAIPVAGFQTTQIHKTTRHFLHQHEIKRRQLSGDIPNACHLTPCGSQRFRRVCRESLKSAMERGVDTREEDSTRPCTGPFRPIGLLHASN